MSDTTLIADLIRSGLDPDLVQRVASALIEVKGAAPVALVRDDGSTGRTARQERNRRYYESHKHLKASESDAVKTDSDTTPAPSSSPASQVSPVPPSSPTPPPAPPPTGVREGDLFGGEGKGHGDKPAKPGKNLPGSPTAQRIAAIFHRRLVTSWTPKEVKAFRALGTIDEEDLAAVEAYYAAHWPPCRDRNVLRHDLLTFLNNFRGEVDRARQQQPKQQPAPGGKPGGFLAGTGFEKQ